ncbi:hypothetical protein ACF0H5_023896 [Mactra antiquata]
MDKIFKYNYHHTKHPCDSSPCLNGGICSNINSNTEYFCSCYSGFSGESCETPVSTFVKSTTASTSIVKTSPTTATTVTETTATSPTRQTTLAPTQTTPVVAIKANVTCSKYNTIFNIAEENIEINDRAGRCISGSSATPEAFVMNVCHLETTATWRPGVNVIQNCEALAKYAPISTFRYGQIHHRDDVSAILVGCLSEQNGFQIAIQNCDSIPIIMSVVPNSDPNKLNPNDFFRIEVSE